MCLAIPAKVISVDGQSALVTIEDVEYNASLMLLDDVHAGDHDGHVHQLLIGAGAVLPLLEPHVDR